MNFPRQFFLLVLAASFLSGVAVSRAGESLSERTLKQLVDRQQQLFREAAKDNPNFDQENFKSQLQQLCNSYDLLLRDNSQFAAAYVAYALLLDKVDMRKESTRLMLRANQLDKNIPVVKNQLGNYLAEEGKPLEAVNYYLSAVQLEPKEPLYHYQLGTLLAESMDDFLLSGLWTRAAVDKAMHNAFEQAMLLSPNDWRYAYRFGLSFYDLANPDWDAALEFWRAFEKKLKPGVEQQTCHLHEAKVLIALHRNDEARPLLDGVTEPLLAQQKDKMIAELNAIPTAVPPSSDSLTAPPSATPPVNPSPAPSPPSAAAPETTAAPAASAEPVLSPTK